MQADGRLVAAGLQPAPRYDGMVHALLNILRQEGAAGLWRGTSPAVQRAALVNLGELATYDQVGGMHRGHLCCRTLCTPENTSTSWNFLEQPGRNVAICYWLSRWDPVTSKKHGIINRLCHMIHVATGFTYGIHIHIPVNISKGLYGPHVKWDHVTTNSM
jgi:hypothetical protein